MRVWLCLFRGHACLLDTHRRLSAICGICKVVRANLVSKITSSLTQQDINVPAPLPWRFSSGLTVIRLAYVTIAYHCLPSLLLCPPRCLCY